MYTNYVLSPLLSNRLSILTEAQTRYPRYNGLQSHTQTVNGIADTTSIKLHLTRN
jgi:hypothetical protein